MGPAWQAQSRCKELKEDAAMALFFIKAGQSANPARRYCALCPVQMDCRNYAVMYRESGIWGGTTDQERESLYPLIGVSLREKAAEEGTLESRRVDDFLPEKEKVQAPVSSVDNAALETLLQQVEQLEVLDLLCLLPSVPQESAA